jgi:hypothetical protein
MTNVLPSADMVKDNIVKFHDYAALARRCRI